MILNPGLKDQTDSDYRNRAEARKKIAQFTNDCYREAQADKARAMAEGRARRV